jgi:hypothetical protein
MVLTLMADDRDMILGELREGFRQLAERLKRQDDVSLIRDQQRETDKREAIEARNKLHEQNQRELREIREKATQTFGLASVAFNWIEDRGKPLMVKVDELATRVGALEEGEKIEDAESRGKKAAYALVGGAVGVSFTAFTAMTEGVLENIKRLFHILTGQGHG